MPSLPGCRVATVSDAAALARLASETFLHTWRALVPDADRAVYVAAVFTPDALAADLARPEVTYLVLESEATLVGYARVSKGAPPPPPLVLSRPALLDRFYLLSDWHGTGAAQQLLAEVIALAHSESLATLWLCHHPSNTRAERFYLRQGFTHTGIGHPFELEGKTYHDVVLTHTLT
jgi:diamine N-acetyltransferase